MSGFQFSLTAIRFEEVRSNIVKFLTERGKYDANFDFAGSNLSYFIDTMAYTTMLMSYMLSTVANDNFLDTTTLRKNATSIAKTMGYKPKRIQSSRIEGTFSYRPGNVVFTSESKITIPPNTVFKGTDDSYDWVNNDPIVLTINPKDPYELTSAADQTKPRISLIQGVAKKFTVLGTGASLQSFTIPSTKIDENNMRVSIFTTNKPESSKIQWTHAKTFYQIQNEEIYFVEEDITREGSPKIIFGNGIIGRAPTDTETIVVDYIETVGDVANGETDLIVPTGLVISKSFDLASVDTSLINFVPAGPSFGGKPYETLDEIKVNAPRFFAAAGRSVTENDFATLIENEFSYLVNDVVVFGGDKLAPGNKLYLGSTYIAATPASSDGTTEFLLNEQIYLTESSETEIIRKLRDIGIIATEKNFRKPSYTYLQIAPIIEVSYQTSAADRQYTEQTAYKIITDYFANEFSGFGVPYRESKARSKIDSIDSVLSTSLTAQYGFVLNKDSFYITKPTQLWLPVQFKRNEQGSVERTIYDTPVTTNFVKHLDDIIVDTNVGRQSVLELFRLTVASNGSLTTEQVTNVWHNRDVEDSTTNLDTFWKPQLLSVPFVAVLDFGSVTFDGTTNGNFEIIVDGPRDNVYVSVSNTDMTGVFYNMGDFCTAVVESINAQTYTDDFSAATDGTNIFVSGITNFSIVDNSSTFGSGSFTDGTYSVAHVTLVELNSSLYDDYGQIFELRFVGKRTDSTGVLTAYVMVAPDNSIEVKELTTARDYVVDIIQIESDFDVTQARPLASIPYASISVRRVFDTYNILPEVFNGAFVGRTSIHGTLTHADLDRYLFNNDIFTAKSAKFVVLEQNGNKSLIHDTYTIKGLQSNVFTSSLSFVSTDGTTNTYSVYFINTTQNEKQKVATLVWDKRLSGKEQFEYIIQAQEAAWLKEQGFTVTESDATSNSDYDAFALSLDENGNVVSTIDLRSAISSVRLGEKEFLCSFVHDGTAFVADANLREFTVGGEKIALVATGDSTSLIISFQGNDLFAIEIDSTTSTGYSATIVGGEFTRTIGLRNEIVLEPYVVDGSFHVGLFAYGIFHLSTIGSMEYETGEMNFDMIVSGNYQGGEALETAEIHIRDLFDNYGDVKMDVISIIPENKVEIIDGIVTTIGSLTDFDSVFTQTTRVLVEPIVSRII